MKIASSWLRATRSCCTVAFATSDSRRTGVVDVCRLEKGVLVEHWDVIQDEVTREQSKSGNPMFGKSFPALR
jgi:predicted SnoaL-like aldol condensation-catalyzing enzyme